MKKIRVCIIYNKRIGERIRDRKIAKCYNAVMGFWILHEY